MSSGTNASYIGKTERSLKTRILEHRRHIHIENSEHQVDMDGVKILAVELRFYV